MLAAATRRKIRSLPVEFEGKQVEMEEFDDPILSFDVWRFLFVDETFSRILNRLQKFKDEVGQEINFLNGITITRTTVKSNAVIEFT